MWQVERNSSNTYRSKMDFTLSLCMEDLRTYPSGKRILLKTPTELNKFKEERLKWYDATGSDKIDFKEVEFDVTTPLSDVLKIVVKNLNVKKRYLCEIFLGEGPALEKPKLQSPYLISSEFLVSLLFSAYPFR